MGKTGKTLVAVLIFILALFCFKVMAVSGEEVENIFGVGVVAGAIEAPYSFAKNVIFCSSVWDCINLPKHLGKGLINGVERIVGTTVLPGIYHREFGKNSKIAENKLLSNVVGWGTLGYLAITTEVLHFGPDAIFSINQEHNAGLVLGTLVGAGAGAVDVAIERDLYDRE